MKNIAVVLGIIFASFIGIVIYVYTIEYILLFLNGGDAEYAAFWLSLAPTPIFLFIAVVLVFIGNYFKKTNFEKVASFVVIADFTIKIAYYLYDFL